MRRTPKLRTQQGFTQQGFELNISMKTRNLAAKPGPCGNRTQETPARRKLVDKSCMTSEMSRIALTQRRQSA
jgi:hypothetical protein